MNPIYSKQSAAERKRLEEERTWFAAGLDACGTGLELTDWPRPDGPKYSQLWYRIKWSWQEGWKSGAGRPISKHESDITPHSLNDRLFHLIRDKAPIPLRQVLRSFSSQDSASVKVILRAFEENGFIRTTGHGTRSQPVIIEKV